MRIQIILFLSLFFSGCSIIGVDTDNDDIFVTVDNTIIYSDNSIISVSPPGYNGVSFERLITNIKYKDIIVLRRKIQDKIVEKMRLSVEKINRLSSELYLDKTNIEKFRIDTQNTKGKLNLAMQHLKKLLLVI